jgi:type IV pilus assembly protein PilQ
MCLVFVPVGVLAQTADTTAERTMSLDVKDTDIEDVIRMISKGYDLNIILDKDVTGKVTLHLTDVPIMEGLQSLARSHGWEVSREGRVYFIRKATDKTRSVISYNKGLLTLDVQNMDVIDFIKTLSSKTAVSIVPDSKVNGKVSGKLYRVSVDDGLRAILEGNGFSVTKRKNIYRVENEQAATTSRSVRRRRRSVGGAAFHVEYYDDMITLDVANGNLADVIQAIAEQSEVEIVTYGNITGEVNAMLNEIPLTEALALLLGGTKFTFVQKENVILIGDRNTATPSGQALSKSELVHLRHIKADEVLNLLPANISPNKVKVVKEQNALLVTGTSEVIVQTREFLATIDIPTPQVVIDAVVVEYTRNTERDFGIEYGHGKDGGGGDSYAFPHLQYNRSGDNARYFLKKSLPLFDENFINKLPDDFWITLRLLEAQKKAKVLAQPSITVLNGNKAQITVDQTQYFEVRGGTADNPTLNLKPISYGIRLSITPWISRSGQITAEITPEISNSTGISEGTNASYPDVARRSVTTTVRIDDGKTLVLGGLLRSDKLESNKKVPFLGDLPIIGALFRTNVSQNVRTNLVIYITPHIIDEDSFVDLESHLREYDREHTRFRLHRGFLDGVNYHLEEEETKNDANDGGDEEGTAAEGGDMAPPAARTDDAAEAVDTAVDQPLPGDTTMEEGR